ncbi:PAS-domain containing protein [Oceaniovalibus guishaninsula]|nr:PAS-domain containing protein [Oceaniovalibus guishaninsula]
MIWLAGLCAAALFAAALTAALGTHRRRLAGDRSGMAAEPATTAILIEDDAVIDATERGRAWLAGLETEEPAANDLQQAERALARDFPGFSAALIRAKAGVAGDLISTDGTGSLRIEPQGTRLRLTLCDAERRSVTLDGCSHASLLAELQTLRDTAATMPFIVWKQDAGGQIVWANRAYLDVVAASGRGTPGTWPPPALFDIAAAREKDGLHRVRLPGDAAGQDGWYECHVTEQKDGLLVSAMQADAIVSAETTLRDFVQTLSRTFADLSIGLAVFNRKGRLAMFNPALGDLTTLPIATLLGQPTLASFLDALRARSMMPEPRDYAAWRRQIADLERDAKNGTYSELWHLPSSRTFRVTGRPQPDGAVALLIEDVSAGIGLTRDFRARIDMGQSVLDRLDDAIAVFDATGLQCMTNAAYDALWPDTNPQGDQPVRAADAVAAWTGATAPSPLWQDAARFLGYGAERADWSGTARLLDGRGMKCHFLPLAGGATMVRFELLTARKRRTIVPPQRQTAIAERLKA